MKTSLPYFLQFPDNFYKTTVEKIINTSIRGENTQLIGLKGSAKSLLFRYLLTSDKLKKEFKVFRIDFNLINEKTVKACTKLLLSEYSKWKKVADKREKKVIILIDSFENVFNLSNSLLSVFNGITDSCRDLITFVFSVERPLDINIRYWGEKCFLPPLSKDDFDWFWRGLQIDDKFKRRISEVSGNYPAIIKRLVEIVNENGEETLEKTIENPRINPHLNYQLELMKEGLNGRENYFDVPIYNLFINGPQNNELTKLENKAYLYLEKNKGIIIERDDLIKNIWGEFASCDVADHALDQLIHRLQKKLQKKNIKIETIRGRGHRMLS